MAHTFTLRAEIAVRAPIERCFLLSTSVAIVERELGMHPVRGRTSGLVTAGDTIRWEGRQFAMPQFHESLIEDFRPFIFFRDRMIGGRFASFVHDHSFTELGDSRVMLRDELRFTMPWGWLGDLIGACILAPHIRRLMRRRFRLLKRIAEGEAWRQYLPQDSAQFDSA
jgi:ligand-binding SRPBCC domain-containing protein